MLNHFDDPTNRHLMGLTPIELQLKWIFALIRFAGLHTALHVCDGM